MREQDYFEDLWYRNYLIPGEYVKWNGKSERKTGFNPLYLFLIPFFTIWWSGVITATIALTEQAFSGETSFFDLVFMIPFWAGGSFFIYALFILPYVLKKKTMYAVTNKKVMQYYRGKVRFINLDPMPLIQMSVINEHGYGSITIGGTYNASDYSNYFPMIPGQNQGSIVISNIKDPTKVYQLITENKGRKTQ